MKSGNVFIDKEGTDISRIEVERRNQVLHDYYVMREDARKNKDKFFCVNATEWEDFFSNIWSLDNPYWEGVDLNYIIPLQTGMYLPKLIDNDGSSNGTATIEKKSWTSLHSRMEGLHEDKYGKEMAEILFLILYTSAFLKYLIKIHRGKAWYYLKSRYFCFSKINCRSNGNNIYKSNH